MKFEGNHRQGPVTERLVLHAFEVSDGEAFYRLNSDPDVLRYTGDPPVESAEAAAEGIRSHPDWKEVGIGRWATVDRASEEVIGFAGLKYLPELDVVDLGYRFLPAYWGKGLATEASIACLAYGFDVLGLERIVGITMPENQVSIRVLEKVGMVREDPITYDGEPAELFAIDAARYRARTDGKVATNPSNDRK